MPPNSIPKAKKQNTTRTKPHNQNHKQINENQINKTTSSIPSNQPKIKQESEPECHPEMKVEKQK